MTARGALAGGLVTLVTLVGGCDNGPAHQRHAGRPEVGHPLGGAAHVTAAEQATYTAAEDVLTAVCMRRRGFRYVARPVHRPGGPDPTNPYGLLTPAQARVHGYGMAEGLLASPPPDPNATTRALLSTPQRSAWDAALVGTDTHRRDLRIPAGGVFTYRTDACTVSAHQRLLGPGWDRLFLSVRAASDAVVRDVLRTDGVRTALRRWSACMRARGHRAQGPPEVRRAVADRLREALAAPATDTASRTAALRLEQRLAMADAACQDSSGAWQAVAQGQRLAERACPPSARAAAGQLREARTRAMDRARSILRTAGTRPAGR